MKKKTREFTWNSYFISSPNERNELSYFSNWFVGFDDIVICCVASNMYQFSLYGMRIPFRVSTLTELPISSLIITMNDISLKNEMHTIMGFAFGIFRFRISCKCLVNSCNICRSYVFLSVCVCVCLCVLHPMCVHTLSHLTTLLLS